MKKLFIFFVALAFILGASAQKKTISGIVYEDFNRNQQFDSGEKRLKNVAVSNGEEVVITNQNGKYKIDVENDEAIFVIKPSHYQVPLTKNNVPLYYEFQTPTGSPDLHFDGLPPNNIEKNLNFGLYPNPNEDNLKVALLGDTQTKTIDEVYYLSKVVDNQLIDNDIDLVIPLGDLTYDNLSLFNPIKETLGKIGAPVHYVYGNHDRNYDAKKFVHRDESFNNNFGPSYYAFEYGNHSFIVLNNVNPKPNHQYVALIDDEQMNFVANYLKHVPEEKNVHLLMHIPLEQVKNIEEFSKLFINHNNVSAYAGHTHIQFFKTIDKEVNWVTKPINELVAGAVCGTWWHGEKDSFGIPEALMPDGTPKGFWVMNLTNNTKKLDYKTAETYNKQMSIWLPFQFENELIQHSDQKIYANVFAGNENTSVKIKFENSEWVPMTHTVENDPYFLRLKKLEEMGVTPTKNSIKLVKPRPSSHLWSIDIPNDFKQGVHQITIIAENEYGLNTKANALLFIQ